VTPTPPEADAINLADWCAKAKAASGAVNALLAQLEEFASVLKMRRKEQFVSFHEHVVAAYPGESKALVNAVT